MACVTESFSLDWGVPFFTAIREISSWPLYCSTKISCLGVIISLGLPTKQISAITVCLETRHGCVKRMEIGVATMPVTPVEIERLGLFRVVT